RSSDLQPCKHASISPEWPLDKEPQLHPIVSQHLLRCGEVPRCFRSNCGSCSPTGLQILPAVHQQLTNYWKSILTPFRVPFPPLFPRASSQLFPPQPVTPTRSAP